MLPMPEPKAGPRATANRSSADSLWGSVVLLGYAVFCALVIAGCVCALREQFGTHRPLIHVAAVLLAGIYVVVARRTKVADPLQLLGLRPPRAARWAWLFLLLGVASGVGRFVVYRWTGLGGVQLYEQQFAGFLHGASPGEVLLRWAVFPVLVYLAVLLPGVLFFGVIQESFRRVGLLATGLFLQALLFGLVHCYMTGTFDLVYAVEAFLGGLAFGIACHWLKNVYVPAVLLAANVVSATLLATF
jgi:membrane protease YdiL (CAAX protease family)